MTESAKSLSCPQASRIRWTIFCIALQQTMGEFWKSFYIHSYRRANNTQWKLMSVLIFGCKELKFRLQILKAAPVVSSVFTGSAPGT